ncbi:RNA polymerase sigma-70 factor (ECF subfamily) [Pseudonocardia hierapolitana]|uniref:RNA polymerase sigma-70 factor (ECF subfamily) n=1 Tax=Pseudonocardia hierapolitana TaxID=1128676 RepID=A0A561T0H2_9PSEU|nr:sigma-70 family RNA polymerase sigma factor [Pseudonocardia hierapolitana]TWF80610.1 RNA polymerase sigma-70 factor (ECF subfamily) [Pseudonocardia hierapolitana]
MAERDRLAERFQELRPRLRAVAYRMLGSTSEADDVVQEAWIRLSRADAAGIDNLEAWLVTATGRVALNMLRSRATRREEPLDGYLPDPIVDRADAIDPEHEALLADSVGLALLVVLDTLSPAERLAYVLHDMFSVPFDEIGAILERSPDAARQLASRARRRIRGVEATTAADAAAQQEVVGAFLAAARHGEFDALVAVLDPDIVIREDTGSGTLFEMRGAENVARRAAFFSQLGLDTRPALVNGAAGWVARLDGELYAVAALTVRDDRIREMDILRDPARLAALDVTIFDSPI